MTIENKGTTDLDAIQIRREPLSEQVAEQIQNIIQDKLKEGDRLPPERDLSEKFGVSRVVIREATKILQERGLVKILTGSGTYVSRVEPEVVFQSMRLFVRGNKHSFRDLLEIRKMLEVEIAGLAADRATDDDIHQLEVMVNEMQAALPEIRSSKDKLEDFVEADLSFHQDLAKASHNFLLPILLSPITDLLLEFRRKASSFPGAPENATNFHQTILDCIRNRDSRKSRDVMRSHLSNTEEFLDLMVEDDLNLDNQPNE
jgi:GntR family transcriptional repressor for pyruvate dehydrogenase complex